MSKKDRGIVIQDQFKKNMRKYIIHEKNYTLMIFLRDKGIPGPYEKKKLQMLKNKLNQSIKPFCTNSLIISCVINKYIKQYIINRSTNKSHKQLALYTYIQ